jgi:hypothetical protein
LSAFAVACLLFVWLWSDYRDYWLDDAFITFRYSRHLAEGIGAVYNPGEYVEGYTSLLWMLLSSLALWLEAGSTGLLVIKLFSLSASLWILYRVWTFPSPCESDPPVRRYWVLVLATQPVFILNCGDGMETPLFMLLLVECARAFQSEPGRNSGAQVGLFTAAMVLTRPESLPLLVLLPALMGFAHRGQSEDKHEVRRWLGAFLLAGLLPVVCHEIWRLGYYGYPVPNTFYAKATGAQLVRLADGAQDVGRFLFDNPWRAPVAIWIALGLAGVASLRLTSRAEPRVMRFTLVLWLMLLFRLAFDLWSGSDTMGRHRFLAPLLVPLMILADEGARDIWRRTGANEGTGVAAGTSAVIALVGLSLYFNVTGHLKHEVSTADYRSGLKAAHMALGDWLRGRYPADTVLAIGDAGAVPYFSRLTTIDLWGLNDAEIAHMPGEYGRKPSMPAYVFARKPGVVVLWNRVPFVDGKLGRVFGGREIDVQLAGHVNFARDYRFVREFVFRDHTPQFPGYYLDVFERR